MSNIYLLAASSYNVIKRKLDELINGNKNVTINSLNDLSISDIVEDASYYGLFEEERVIIIKDCKYFSGKFIYEEDMEILTKFLSNLDKLTKVIIICDGIEKTKNNTKSVISMGANIFDFTKQNEELEKEIINNFLETENIKIDDKTLELIKENCLNNIDTIILEISKLSNVDKTITTDIVNKSGIKLDKIDDYAFSNAVIAKDFNKAFNELDKLIENGVEPFSVVGILASSYTNMYMVRDAASRGLSDEEIAKTLNYSSDKRVYMMKKNSKIYTMDELKEIIINLSELDIKIKTGTNPVYAIKEFLLNL